MKQLATFNKQCHLILTHTQNLIGRHFYPYFTEVITEAQVKGSAQKIS